MKNGAVIFTAVVIAGCAAGTGAPNSEDLEYRRASEHVEALEQFDDLKRSCARSGGVVFVRRHNGGRLARTPTALEMKSASCSPPTAF
jgi:hypothetical protein